MMWNETVVVRQAGAGRGMESGAEDSRPVALPRPRASASRLRAHGEAGVVTAAPAHGVPGPAFVHVAALVRSDAELFGAAMTWGRQGVEAGDLVVVAGTPGFQQAVAEELGDDDRVWFDDRVRPNGHRGPDALGAVIDMSRRARERGSGRLRILAQVDQPDDHRVVREFSCLESASNLVPVAAPTTTLCLYDERRLAPELVRSAAATHPHLLEPDGLRPSDRFVDPREFVRSLPPPREPLQDSAPLLAVDDAASLAALRHALGAQLVQAVVDRDRREDLHLAISEMAANAFRHGGRPVGARLWASADRLVCTITDGGTGVDPLRGYWPAHGQDLARGGMGLWLARKLCDHVDLVSDERGTTVRLATALR
jgi:anti-sigma regulatory factor (Ser/Thr protein kinase)